MNDTYQGANIDTRTEEEKAKDYRFEEIVASAAPVNWIEKPKKDWRKFPIFDQGQSGSCVAQTGKKQLGVYIWLKAGEFIALSATHIYSRRANKPAGGMNGNDVYQIMQKGTTLAQLVPDEKMNDAQMDAVKISDFDEQIGQPFKIGNYFVVGTKDIDLIASIIQETGKAVMVWFYFKHDEWDETPDIKYDNLDLYGGSTSRHSVAAVDFTLVNGKKCLIIDDSWGPKAGNGAGQRVITEDFFKVRNWYAAHFMNFKFEGANDTKPHHNFTKTLKFSSTYTTDPEVVALQDCLKYLGFFPSNTESTGYFGSVTKKAVEQFQTNQGLTPDGIVGPATNAKLNVLFNN